VRCEAQYVWFDGALWQCHGEQLGCGETMPVAQLRSGNREDETP
jgi:hypothetical protein